jgi:hypothetical protein
MTAPSSLNAALASPVETLSALLTARNALGLLGVWLAYQLVRAAWNISPMHPLSRIPGPKLAAATYLPEFYYDVVKFGRYTNQIAKMHEVYGIPSLLAFVEDFRANAYMQVPLSVSVLMRYTATTRSSSTRSTLLVAGSATSPNTK